RPALEQGLVRGKDASFGAYEFAHALFRDAAEHRLRHDERCDLHARLAAAYEGEGAPDDERVHPLAHHAWMAYPLYDPRRARDWALRAASRARVACAYDREAELLRRAVHITDQLASSAADAIDLRLRLAESQHLAGGWADALATLDAAAAASRALADGVRFARAALLRTEMLGDAAAADATAKAHVAEALATSPRPSAEHTVLLASHAFSNLFFRAPDEGRALWRSALQMARAHGDPASLAKVIAIGLRFCDDAREARDLADELVELEQKGASGLDGHLGRTFALLQLGRRVEWEDALVTYAEAARRRRDPKHGYLSAAASSTQLLFAGDLAGAERRARDACARGREIGDAMAVPLLGSCLVALYRVDPQGPNAASHREEVREIGKRTLAMAPGYVGWQVWLMSLDLDRGDVEAAARAFRRAVAHLPRLSKDCNYYATVAELGHVAIGLREQDWARTIYTSLLPYAELHIAPASLYFGPVQHTLYRLQSFLGDASAAREHAERAREAVESLEARPWIDALKGGVDPARRAEEIASRSHGARAFER
ncbi:MAG: hypothetical protein JOZ69_09810, partial [Myxococcales bacterium]|nr:hypothetical protein [Myxococcales bacterium]